jgi:8-amino-7-oxononanoate synthase
MSKPDKPGAQQSLAQYATRRYWLAGGALLTDFNPFFAQVDQLKRELEAAGKSLLSFAHYDYLSLGQDERVAQAIASGLDEFGPGAGASRLVGGERTIHRTLEAKLAAFVGTDDALALVSGYGTNLALVGHLLTTGDLILADEYAHNSIMLGTKLSRAETRVFKHNDLEELAAILDAERGSYRRVLVVVEGLYSMEGDIPDLPALLEIAERHSAWLMIDEAHSIGVLGQNGRGICEHFGIDPGRIDLIVGTMSKAFASCGGFICAKAEVVHWLRYTLPGFVYSVGLPPHVTAGVIKGLEILEQEPRRVSRLHHVSKYFVAEAKRLGFDVGSAIGAGVVPIKLKTPFETVAASKALLDAGIYVPPVVQIGVPKDMPRLRFFISASHSFADIDRVFDVLVAWREACHGVEGEAGQSGSHMGGANVTQLRVSNR